jgi:DNA-binding FadR family transcriptional regulator
MLNVTPEEISQFRGQLADSPEALAALDAIEECEGNLEAAAQLIAVETTDAEVSLRADSNYLEKLAQKLSNIICQEEFDELMEGVLTAAIAYLAASGNIPVALATPVVIYVAKIGKKQFCETAKPES